MRTNLGQRVGTFLILAGIGFLMVFVTYDLGVTEHFDLFLISLILIFIGARMKSRGKINDPGSRFKSIQNLREKYKQKDDQEASSKK